MNPEWTVLIPAFNEQIGISATIHAISQELTKLAVDYEILVVDDGSVDQTATVVKGIMAQDPHLRLVQHPCNLGIGAGVKTGIEQAHGEWLIFIPADLAMRPEELTRYLTAAENADVVLGNRSDRRDYTLSRKFISFVNITLLKLLFGLKQHQFSYINLYRMAVLRQIRIETAGVFISHELIIKARDLGARIVEVEIDYVPRATGQARGAKASTVLLTLRHTLAFWVLWLWRTASGTRAKGYYTHQAKFADDSA